MKTSNILIRDLSKYLILPALTDNDCSVFIRDILKKLSNGEVISKYETLNKLMDKIDDTSTYKGTNSKQELHEYFIQDENMQFSQENIERVRKSRKVTITETSKVEDVINKIVLTSNILLTMPRSKNNVSNNIADSLDFSEEQGYWFDHPIPLDIDFERNEIVYGIRNLNLAIKKETNKKVPLILSVSCTHKSIKRIAKKYIQSILSNVDTSALDIYVFSEIDTHNLIDEAFQMISEESRTEMKDAIGVDGKYGRHYSFLKGIAYVYNKCVDSNIEYTLKIDLDQVFPQDLCKKLFGKYCFELLSSGLINSKGIDSEGRKVVFGMFAGALYNQTDFDQENEMQTYLSADVKLQDTKSLDSYILNNNNTQVLSTYAELCNNEQLNNVAWKRYHITGGMNGGSIDYLKKYKPFTPSFISRAEDQAFILSVINDEIDGEYLRYVHIPNFRMRHDKEEFIGTEISNNEVSKYVGDLERILLFSHYTIDILSNYPYIKREVAPFTATFISSRMYEVVLARFLTKLTMYIHDKELFTEFYKSFCRRIIDVLDKMDNQYYLKRFDIERHAWDIFYGTRPEKFNISKCKVN